MMKMVLLMILRHNFLLARRYRHVAVVEEHAELLARRRRRVGGGGSGGGAGDCADFVFEEVALSRGTRSGLRAGGGGSGKAAAATAVAVIRRGRGAVEGYGSGFEGAGSHLGGGEGAEPHTLAAAREPDLRHPTAP